MTLEPLLRSFPGWLVRAILMAGDIIFGRKLRIHRIPFGPLKGCRICMRFSISPRMFLGINEPWTTKLIFENVEPGNIVYDIGAHIGYTCLASAMCLEGSGSLHAFELLPSNAVILRKTLEANRIQNAVVHEVGLASAPGTMELSCGTNQVASIHHPPDPAVQTQTCRLATLDEYATEHHLPRPDFIKIDVEGAEVECLSGGSQLIRQSKPFITIDIHDIAVLKQVHPLLDSWGYSMHLESGELLDAASLASLKEFKGKILSCLPPEG